LTKPNGLLNEEIAWRKAHTAAFNLFFPFALSQTPPPARAAQSIHTRGAPHSAKPNAAGGGVAAAHACCPLCGQHGAAQLPTFAEFTRLN